MTGIDWRDGSLSIASNKASVVGNTPSGLAPPLDSRPLLPGSASSLVLVTSRRRLAALQDATVISLDTLPPEEAAQLLAQLAGRPDLGSATGPGGN